MASAAPPSPVRYAVVVSQKTLAQSEWKKVVDTLVAKHGGKVIEYQKLADALVPLRQAFPTHAAFVATPDEAGREFVAAVHCLARKIDDDPYTDFLWGILTGFDAAGALAIAETREPLVVRRCASGTELALDRCPEGIWYCELEKHRLVRKLPGENPKQERGPADTTSALAQTLTDYRADLFVTSGHATEREWQIGFRYQNGHFVSKQGKLYGVDTSGRQFPIVSPNPKVYLPIGNCLMGHIDGPDAMALAFMHSAGVRQMIGYTVPTWYGYGGWGCLDYFVEQPGRYTFAEAFFANHQALLHKLETESPGAARAAIEPGGSTNNGLLHDRDVVAFYGDPAWQARMAPGELSYEQSLVERAGEYTFTLRPLRGAQSFEPVNTNGSQRGWRPMLAWLPHRVGEVEVIAGSELKPVITDNFLLVPNPRTCDPARTYQVVFRAKKLP